MLITRYTGKESLSHAKNATAVGGDNAMEGRYQTSQ